MRKLTKMSNLILCFSEISKTFICVRVKHVTFLFEDCKKLSVWSSVLRYGFHFRDAWKRSIQKADGIKRVCPSQQGLHFQAWPIYRRFTVDCHMIICKYLNLSHKPDYQHSGLNTYQFVWLFQLFKKVFVLKQQKRLNLWEIAMI